MQINKALTFINRAVLLQFMGYWPLDKEIDACMDLQVFTGSPGKYVDLKDTIKGFTVSFGLLAI